MIDVDALFAAVHEYLDDTLNENLDHHNFSSCLVCKSKSSKQFESPQAQTPTVDIFSKLRYNYIIRKL